MDADDTPRIPSTSAGVIARFCATHKLEKVKMDAIVKSDIRLFLIAERTRKGLLRSAFSTVCLSMDVIAYLMLVILMDLSRPI